MLKTSFDRRQGVPLLQPQDSMVGITEPTAPAFHNDINSSRLPVRAEAAAILFADFATKLLGRNCHTRNATVANRWSEAAARDREHFCFALSRPRVTQNPAQNESRAGSARPDRLWRGTRCLDHLSSAKRLTVWIPPMGKADDLAKDFK